jgi:uncharacterized membrane protein YhaH (DUF805 family)
VRDFSRFGKKYATFSGRASRSEYCWWVLWNVIIIAALSIVVGIIAYATGDDTAGTSATSTACGTNTVTGFTPTSPSVGILGLRYLALLIPTIAITARRLHDANLRAWWILLIPILGSLTVLILTILSTNPAQRFVISAARSSTSRSRTASSSSWLTSKWIDPVVHSKPTRSSRSAVTTRPLNG